MGLRLGLRNGRASLNEAYAGEASGHLVLFNLHIPEYEAANRFNHEPRRPRNLLVHKREGTVCSVLCAEMDVR